MNKITSSEADITLRNFSFDTREMELIHRQFSGQRSSLIQSLDELLRCWAMSATTNPSVNIHYHLKSAIEDGEVQKREQHYEADHAVVNFTRMGEPVEMPQMVSTIELKNPTDAIRVYDAAFAIGKVEAPRHTIASYFSLREFVAQAAREAVFAKVCGRVLTMVIKDKTADTHHFIDITLTHFPYLSTIADTFNVDSPVAV